MRGNNVIERLYAAYMPAPFLSLLIDDCIATRQGLPRRRRALQHHLHPGRGHWARSPMPWRRSSTMSSSRKTLSMDELLAALEADFAGHERVRQLLLNRTPRYGNDDDYADELMRARLRGLFQRGRRAAEHHAAASTTSTCCRPPATSTSAR